MPRKPRKAKKRRYHHGDLRRTLLDAAVELVALRGVDDLSLRALARHAGVSSGAPYHHFASKKDLLAAIAVDGFARLADAMRIARDAPGSRSPADRLAAIGEAYVRFALEHPAHYELMFKPGLTGTDDQAAGGPPADAFQILVDATADVVALPEVGARASHPAMIVLSWSIVHGAAALLRDGPLAGGLPDLGVRVEDVPTLATRTFAALLGAR